MVLTAETFSPYSVSEASISPSGPHQGRSHCQAAEAETRSADFSTPSVRQAPIITVTMAPRPEYLAVMPRSGDKPHRHVTEVQARSLLALALVDPICRSRRGVIVGLRIRLGVSVATINAALRQGAGNKLPIAEDNRTVRRVMASTFEHIRTAAWDDGRNGDEQ